MKSNIFYAKYFWGVPALLGVLLAKEHFLSLAIGASFIVTLGIALYGNYMRGLFSDLAEEAYDEGAEITFFKSGIKHTIPVSQISTVTFALCPAISLSSLHLSIENHFDCDGSDI